MTTKRIFAMITCVALATAISAADKPGANGAAARIAATLADFSIAPATTVTLDDDQVETLIALCDELEINVFELIDCVNRVVAPQNSRVVMRGSSLRKAQLAFDFGGERVLAILPVDKLEHLEVGATKAKGQRALDIFLEAPMENYIEIGTVRYEKKFGFETVSALKFSGAYGITVKKMLVTAPLKTLELYAPLKGAIYVQGLSRPKKWNLNAVRAK